MLVRACFCCMWGGNHVGGLGARGRKRPGLVQGVVNSGATSGRLRLLYVYGELGSVTCMWERRKQQLCMSCEGLGA